MASERWAVMTWNLQGAKPTDLDLVADRIATEQPDVLALQEVRRRQADELASLLHMRSHWTFKHHALSPVMDRKAEGAALLTPHDLDDVGDGVVSAVRSRQSYRRRVAQWARVARDHGGSVRVYNLHLSPHERVDQRRLEATRVARLAADVPGDDPVVVAGDFNNHGEPDVTAILPGVEHVTPAPTNPAEAPVWCLDHVLLPARATEVSASVPGGGDEWAALSDHLPLTVRFSI